MTIKPKMSSIHLEELTMGYNIYFTLLPQILTLNYIRKTNIKTESLTLFEAKYGNKNLIISMICFTWAY